MSKYISPELYAFFIELSENNERPWFNENRQRFEDEVRTPLLSFISDFAPHLREISPHYQAIAKKSGGSLFRIFRDARFSKNKSPYKTQAGIHFRHEAGKDAHAPGFYLHLEPSSVFMGAGLWRPDSLGILKIRQKIVAEPERWVEITQDPSFRAQYVLGGASLKRGPKGFDKEHPLIEDLKRKDFICTANFTVEQSMEEDFMQTFVSFCQSASPFVKFLTEAVELPY